MPRKIVAEMPDGQPVTYENVPDDVTPDQVAERIQKEYGMTPTFISREGGGNPILDTAKVYGSGLLRGILAPGALAADALSGQMKAPLRFAEYVLKGRPLPTLAEKLTYTIENSQRGAMPRTEAEKYGVAALEGAASGIIGGPSTVLRSALQGAASGLGAEVAGHVSDNPLSRVLGGILGGGAASLAGMPKTSRADLARETLRDAKPEDLDAATKFMREVRAQHPATSGINLAQAMPESSNVDAMVGKLANSRYGTHVSAQLRSQPKQVSAAVEGELAALPGTNRPWQDLANNAQDAATDVIKQGYKEAQEAWRRELGSTAPELSQSAMRILDNRLHELEKLYPNTAMLELIRDVRKNGLLREQPIPGSYASSILDSKGKPLTAAGEPQKYLSDALHVKQAIDDRISNFGSRELNSSGNDPKMMMAAQQVRELFNSTLEQHAPKLAAANRAYHAVMEGTVDPLKKSVIGRIAGRKGADDTIEASKAALQQVFEKGTTPGAARSEILDLEKSLRKSNPEVFQDAAVTWLSEKVTAAGKSKDGRFPEAFSSRLTQSLGSPATETAQSAGLRDILAGVARARGVPEDTYQSLPKLMRYVSATAKRPGLVEGASHMDFDQVAGSAVADAGRRGSLINPLRPMFNAWDRITRGDAYSFVDKLITTPEGVEVLRKAAAASSPSDRALAQAMQTFLATSATATPKTPGSME